MTCIQKEEIPIWGWNWLNSSRILFRWPFPGECISLQRSQSIKCHFNVYSVIYRRRLFFKESVYDIFWKIFEWSFTKLCVYFTFLHFANLDKIFCYHWSFTGREEQVWKLLSFAELANISGVEDLKIVIIAYIYRRFFLCSFFLTSLGSVKNV